MIDEMIPRRNKINDIKFILYIIFIVSYIGSENNYLEGNREKYEALNDGYHKYQASDDELKQKTYLKIMN